MKTNEQLKHQDLDVGLNNRNLTVIVKAKELFNARINPENQEEVVDNCTSLLDDEGLESPYGSKNRNFLTVIYMKYVITWDIVLSDPDGDDKGYKVHLVDITQDGNLNFFSKKVLTVESDGKIHGKVIENSNIDGKEEEYTIHFYVTKGRESTPVLPIDPKLQIKKPRN